MKTVLCQKCGRPITSRYDLVTKSAGFLVIVPYHLECYTRDPRGLKSAPALNGEGIFVGIIVIAVLSALFIIKSHWWAIGVVAFILPAVRFASWTMYERHIP